MLEAQLQNILKSSIPPNAALVLALSGGLDSVCLLKLLVSLKQAGYLQHLRAVHVQHSNAPIEVQWASFSAAICKQHEVDLKILPLAIPIPVSRGLEADERTARYQCLWEACHVNEILVTAHHQLDQAESILLALKNGSGVLGLSAMAVGTFQRGVYPLRPLLPVSKAELEAYFSLKKLQCMEDPTNTNVSRDRNFFREKVMKPCMTRWPNFAKSLAHSARLCAEQQHWLDEYIKQLLHSFVGPDQGLKVDPLREFTPFKRSTLIKAWLKQLGYPMIRRSQLEAIWKECAMSKLDAKACVRFGQCEVRRYQNVLYAKARESLPLTNPLLLCSEIEPVLLPYNAGCLVWEADQLRSQDTVVDFPLQISMKPLILLKAKLKKQFFQKNRIPYWLRQIVPHLVSIQTQTETLPFLSGKLHRAAPNQEVMFYRCIWKPFSL